jgi:hypothetical protein
MLLFILSVSLTTIITHIHIGFPMFSDSVVMVLLAEWDLTCDYFNGDWLNEPVPRLFAPDPAAAKAAIDADPSKAFKDIQRIHARMSVSEHVSHEDAWDFVGNPRYPFV